jgi:selenocysteine-specific translation elongation factor
MLTVKTRRTIMKTNIISFALIATITLSGCSQTPSENVHPENQAVSNAIISESETDKTPNNNQLNFSVEEVESILENSEFLFLVNGSFTIAGRDGTFVTGIVDRGTINEGDEVYIISNENVIIKSIVLYKEMEIKVGETTAISIDCDENLVSEGNKIVSTKEYFE